MRWSELKPMDYRVTWSMGDDTRIMIDQKPNRGRTPLVVLLTQDQARTLVAQLTAMLAAGPPQEEEEAG